VSGRRVREVGIPFGLKNDLTLRVCGSPSAASSVAQGSRVATSTISMNVITHKRPWNQTLSQTTRNGWGTRRSILKADVGYAGFIGAAAKGAVVSSILTARLKARPDTKTTPTFDVTGSYGSLLGILATARAVAAAMNLLLPRYPKKFIEA